MRQISIILLFCGICLSVGGARVQISQGQLKGVVKHSRNGAPFHAFLAIPYAEPPVGELRFKEPVTHSGWSGERDASQDAPVCPQDMPYFPEQGDKIFGQEDCLYLNVYTPKLDSEVQLPVLVFIHGGGFLMGEATSGFYGPEYFMDHNVVLVTIQYRLGVLGFLSFSDSSLPGNWGMKDQVLALRWVQNNIRHFGGDPGSVTIFGESAGAASVDFHLISPLSQGLFHKAILQSGSTSCSWALIPQGLARDRARAFTTLTGCPTQPAESTLDCLRKLPVHTFVKTHEKLLIWNNNPMIRFGPVIEPPSSKLNFLPSHPLELPRSQVPVIMGINFREGGIIAAPFCTNNYAQALELNEDLHTRLSLSLGILNFVPYEKSAAFVDKLSDFYLNGQPVSEDNFEGLVDMVTDLCFTHAVVKSARQHKLYGPVYFYLYNYDLPVSFNDYFGNCSRKLGVSHADELYQFFPSTLFSYNNHTAEELTFSKQMLHLWTSFARQGSPDHAEWGPVSSDEIDYLYISRNSVIQQRGLFTERIRFVDTLLQYMNDIIDKKYEKTEL